MKLTIDSHEIKQLETDLGLAAERKIPFATRHTVHQLAVRSRFKSVDRIQKDMILRNKYTERSLQYAPRRAGAISLRISNQSAEMGSTVDYMEDQEFGGVKRKRGKVGTPIATSYSAGQGMNKQPRTRLARASNRLVRLQLQKRKGMKAKGRKQRNAIALALARKNKKPVYMDNGKTKGIYKILSSGQPRMLHALTFDSVRIKPNPTIRPAALSMRADAPNIYFRALRFQLKRLKTFR